MIREATLEDIPAMVEMGQRFARIDPYKDILHENPEQMAAMGTSLIESESGIILVLEREGSLIGMIGMVCSPHFISGEMFSGEVFWWVDQEHRGNGVRLMKAAEKWSREHGAKTMQMIAPTERVGRLYTRMGYFPTEISFQKDLVEKDI